MVCASEGHLHHHPTIMTTSLVTKTTETVQELEATEQELQLEELEAIHGGRAFTRVFQSGL